MGIRLTGSFYDIEGIHYRVDVYDQDFSGTATDIEVKYVDINFDTDKKDNLSSPIMGSRAEVGIVVHYQDTVLPTFIEDFAASAEDRFLLEIYSISASRPVWRGILTPDFAGEEDTSPRYEFRLAASCGLATLKDKPYHNGTALYTGEERFTGHLTTALKKIVHTDVFWGSGDVFLKTAVDWWAESMSSGADDDAMYQGGVDHAAFWDYQKQGGIDKDVLSSYDVLFHILTAFDLRIYQNEGVWWVEQIPYRSTSPYYTRGYTKGGAFVSSVTNSGANVIDQTKTGAKLATVNYDFLPALKKARVTYDVKIRRNFLPGSNLYPSASSMAFNQNISANGGDAIMRLRGSVSFGIRNLSYSGGVNDVLFWVPNLRLLIGSNYLKREYEITNFTINLKSPQWSVDNASRIYLPYNLGKVPGVGLSVNGTFSFEILTPALPADGSTNSLQFYEGSILKWDGTAANPAEFQVTWSASNFFLEVFDEGTPIISEDQVLYEATNPEEMSEVLDVQTRIGTAILSNSAGRVLRYNGSAWLIATYWGQGTETRNKALGDILALNLLNARDTPRRRLNGSLLGNFRMHRLIQTSDGKKWMMQNGTWSLGRNTIAGSWFELDYGASGVSATPIKIKVIPNGPTYPPVLEPVNPQGLSSNAPGFSVNQAPTVLAPVAYNNLGNEISEGDTVTSIPIKTVATGAEFLAGDGVRLLNPITGQFQEFTIATAPGPGDTSLSVTSATALYDFPEDSYLVIKQNAYEFRMPVGTHKGQIMVWDDVAEDWVVYSGSTDGHVLTWDTVNGWQAEAPPAGYTDEQAQDAVGNILVDDVTIDLVYNGATPSITAVRAALTGDVTAPYGSNTLTIAANAVTTAKIAANAVTTAKIADANVTNVKLANMAANTIKGNNTAAAGVPVDLTIGQAQALLGFSNGAANRIPFYTGPNAWSASADLTWNDTNKQATFNKGTDNAVAIVLISSGAITNSTEFIKMSGNVTNSLIMTQVNANNASINAHAIYQIKTGGASAGDPMIQWSIVDTMAMGRDNSDGDKFKITPFASTPGGVGNSGFILTNEALAKVGINIDAPAYVLDVGGEARSKEWINTAANPTWSNQGTAMGTGGTLNFLVGTNNGFFLDFTTGTSPQANAVLGKITLATAFPGNFYPVFGQSNKKGIDAKNRLYFSAIDNGSMTLSSGDTALDASTQYSLYFGFFGR